MPTSTGIPWRCGNVSMDSAEDEYPADQDGLHPGGTLPEMPQTYRKRK